MNEFPQSINWPGRGMAGREFPRGMSDYQRGAGMDGAANYSTDNGARLTARDWKWVASFRSWTTKQFPSPEEAIQNIETMIKNDLVRLCEKCKSLDDIIKTIWKYLPDTSYWKLEKEAKYIQDALICKDIIE